MLLTKGSRVFLITLVAILIIGSLITYFVFVSPTGLKARKDADFAKAQTETEGVYTTLEGEQIDLHEYRDGVVIVNSWASWSPYTETDHLILEELKNRYGEKITILALNRMETKDMAAAYLTTIGKRNGIMYLLDTTDHFFGALEGYAMPETIVFDEVGNEYYRKRGVLNAAEIDQVLSTLLQL